MNVSVLTMMLLAAGPSANEPLPAVCNIKLPEVGRVEMEIAAVEKSTLNAQEVASQNARTRLRDRLCKDGDCDSLEPSIRPWKTAASETWICASAAINTEDYEAWKSQRNTLRETFRSDLEARIAKGVEQLKTVKLKGSLTLAVAPVLDDESIGGGRSRWARLALIDAVGKTGVVVVETNSSVVVDSELVTVDTATSELSWKFMVNTQVVAPSTLRFPNEIAPRGGKASKRAAERDQRLRLHIDTRKGDLCEGQQTQLWLQSDRKRCVVVFDTWGESAVLMFPNASHPSCVIEAGRPVQGGGPKGFRIVGIPGVAEERYVAIAVNTMNELPKKFQAMVSGLPGTESCRLTDLQLRALDDALPGKVIRTELSFRLLQDKTACEGVQSFTEEEAQAFAAMLENLADCPK